MTSTIFRFFYVAHSSWHTTWLVCYRSLGNDMMFHNMMLMHETHTLEVPIETNFQNIILVVISAT